MIQYSVLVLNASYEPIQISSLQRAIKLVMKGAATVEESSPTRVIRAARMSLPAPSVIRLLIYRRVPRQTRAISRKNILLRDRHTCQYCRAVFEPRKLTLDHVMPKSRSGAGTWDNLVASCFPCNNRKGDKTPAEAGMPLLRQPRPYSIHTTRALMQISGETEQLWQKYMFM